VFLTGAVAVTLPLVLDFYLTSLFFAPLIPEVTSGIFLLFSYSMGADIFYSQPLVYVTLHLLLIFVGSGLIALLALIATTFAANRFIVLLAPFICCVFADFVLSSLGGLFFQYSPLTFLQPCNPSLQAFPIIVVTIGMAVSFFAYFVWELKHHETL